MLFNAIVLAADRGRDDPVAAAAGVAAKCLTPIAGSPMAVRVVHALEQSARVNTIQFATRSSVREGVRGWVEGWAGGWGSATVGGGR